MIVQMSIGKDGYADVDLDDRGLISLDGGLDTPVLISMFTRRRARRADRRDKPAGWWGDTYADVAGDQIGSHLWLRSRSNLTTETLRYCLLDVQNALAWMTEDKLAREVTVETSVYKTFLAIGVFITKPDGQTYDRLWKVHLDAV